MRALPLIVALSAGPMLYGGDSQLVAMHDFDGSRDVVQWVFGGAWSQERRYTLADSQLVIEFRDPIPMEGGGVRFDFTKQIRVVLEARQAEAAWKAIEEMGVLGWRTEYKPEDVGLPISDGTQWSMTCRLGERKNESSGDNIYPATYGAFARLFERLELKANQSTDPTPASGTPPAGHESRHR